LGNFNKILYLEMPMGYDDIQNLVSFWCTGNQTINKISKICGIVLATATVLAGWMSVTRQYCIKMAKPILKLFRSSVSPIIVVSSDPCADTKFQGNPFSRAIYTRVRINWRISMESTFIIETARDRPMEYL